MNKKLFIIISSSVIFVSLSYILQSCSNDNVNNPQGTVSFSHDVLPIMMQNCGSSGCHNSVDKKAGIDVTSWNALVIQGSDEGTQVVPYNAYWSHIIWHINRDTNVSPVAQPYMPPGGAPIPANERDIIMKWINEGAKNDNGDVAWSSLLNKAFVTNQAADLVAVVNMDNFRLTRLISVGSRDNNLYPPDAPHVIIADNAGRYFYVSLIAEGYIEKFDAMTYNKAGRLYAGSSPAHIVISNDGTTGYFSNFDQIETTVKKFSTAGMNITDTISQPTMKSNHGLRLTHDNNFLLAASQVSEYLFKIRTADFEIDMSTPVDETVPPNGNGTSNFKPYQIAISKDDRYAFVTLAKANEVRVFDLQNSLMPVATIPVGQNPLSLEISPDGKWCYVPNQASNSVTVIDALTFQVVTTILNVGVQPHTVDFTADGAYALVACESRSGSSGHHAQTSSKIPGTTAVINVNSGHTKTEDIEMASYPSSITITPGTGN